MVSILGLEVEWKVGSGYRYRRWWHCLLVSGWIVITVILWHVLPEWLINESVLYAFKQPAKFYLLIRNGYQIQKYPIDYQALPEYYQEPVKQHFYIIILEIMEQMEFTQLTNEITFHDFYSIKSSRITYFMPIKWIQMALL